MPYKNVKVIQKNAIAYHREGGLTLPCPCGVSYAFYGEFWAHPIKRDGVFYGYEFLLAASYPTAPSFDAFKVTKLKDVETNDTYWVAATKANVLSQINDCGTITEETIPTVVVEVGGIQNGANYEWYFGVPTKASSDEYKVQVALDGVAQDTPAAAGHTDLTAAVTWLNTNIPEAGTWSNASGKLKLVATDQKQVGVTFLVGNYA